MLITAQKVLRIALKMDRVYKYIWQCFVQLSVNVIILKKSYEEDMSPNTPQEEKAIANMAIVNLVAFINLG